MHLFLDLLRIEEMHLSSDLLSSGDMLRIEDMHLFLDLLRIEEMHLSSDLLSSGDMLRIERRALLCLGRSILVFIYQLGIARIL